MLRKINSKLILKTAFIIALIMHFSYSLIQSTGIVDTHESFLIFDRSRVTMNIIFAFALLIAIITEFSKFLNIVEKNSIHKDSLKWIIQRDNLVLFAKLTLMTVPFVIAQLLRFFLKHSLDTTSAFDIFVLTWASFALALAIISILMYAVYKFIFSKSWIQTQDKEVDYLIWSLYFDVMFLDIENFDINNQVIKFENEIEHFLVTTNIENAIQTQIIFSDILTDQKKATTPPLV
ncbi:hypothetical protein [Spiroplasma culicicola]|uniref:Transmembrane protein n=1 Tax=Spiroplasma culicicola AES-1 TaxID=1276246 RepID=W6A6J7_9MOLU|nr:hypothetical protein [Spiroplasma culicicola]AHI52495.1 hypothetical protein SCULI_v1c01540 [Spiroplasma culicicola AES-1]